MNLSEEREINFKIMRELIEERRAISEHILLTRQEIKRLDTEIERNREIMSAKEYIHVRNSIKAELEISMREQLREEIINESNNESNEEYEKPKESIIPREVIEESIFRENQKSIAKPKTEEKNSNYVSFEKVNILTKAFLKERGNPVKTYELKDYLEDKLDKKWSNKSFTQMIWKLKTDTDNYDSLKRGFIQLKSE